MRLPILFLNYRLRDSIRKIKKHCLQLSGKSNRPLKVHVAISNGWKIIMKLSTPGYRSKNEKERKGKKISILIKPENIMKGTAHLYTTLEFIQKVVKKCLDNKYLASL